MFKKGYHLFWRILSHWQYYRRCNSGQRFAFFHYVFRVLFYRRFLCYLIALPVFVGYFLIYPFIKIRLIKLIGSAIGHYALTTELLLCELDELKKDQFKNVFYMEHSLFAPPIANEQLHAMWKRIILILPLFCSPVMQALNQMISFFLSKKAYGMYGLKGYYESRWARDINGFLEKTPPHLNFLEFEHQKAQELLRGLSIGPSDRYVCLLARSSAYNKNNPTWDVPERNADIETYMKACNYLAEQGYYVLRMGKVVDSVLSADNPRIIDYANTKVRSDFMDIYLSANCHFFISTGSGLDDVPVIFRRPVLYTNMLTAVATATWYPHYLFITKKLFYKKTGKLLSFKEQADLFFSSYLKTRRSIHLSDFMKKNDLGYLDNTEDEILAVVREMEVRVANQWVEQEEDQARQSQFWAEFPVDAIFYNPNEKTNGLPLYGKISVKIGVDFLREHQDLL